MSISVVIPLYNKGPHIERALQSVLSQTSLPDEIIVVDDGSTDGSGEIVASLGDPRIRLIRQENQGVSAARNRGIAAAKGELIAFLDADDTWEPRFLEVILRLREKYPQAGAYATAYLIITKDGVKNIPTFNVFTQEVREGLILIPNYLKTSIGACFGMGATPVWTSAVVIPRAIFRTVGKFQVSEPGAWIHEDADMWLRISIGFPIAWSSECLAVYHQDATNRTWTVKRSDREPAISYTVRQALQSTLIADDIKQDLQEYGARFQLIVARDCLVLGKRETALQLLEYAQGTKLFARDWWRWRLLAALPGKSAHYLWKLKRVLESPRN